MDNTEARRNELRKVITENGGHASTVAKYGLTTSQASYLSQIAAAESVASFGEKSARNWELRLRLPRGQLEFAGLNASQASTNVMELSPSPAPGVAVIHVPLLANAGSMGDGQESFCGDVMIGQLTLSRDWVEQRIKPTSLQALRFIHGYGDSMKGTFNDGDILLCDVGIRDANIDGVYVLQAHDRVFIKRVRQRYDGCYEISSDNPSIKTTDVLDGREQLNVLGRVLWAWNGQKL